MIKYLQPNKKDRIAYHQHKGKGPGVIFIHGLFSNMDGAKAKDLEAFCKKRGQAYVRFDCTGHGKSSGKFTDGTIGSWAKDLEAILKLTKGPQILVGSSMGGWLALLMAKRHPKRVKAIVGVAAAPDFTTKIWDIATPAIRKELIKKGVYHRPSSKDDSIPITYKLLQDGKKHLLLTKSLKLKCPVHLIQGMEDKSVFWRHALKISDTIKGNDVKITFIKDADHRLSRKQDITVIQEAVRAFSY